MSEINELAKQLGVAMEYVLDAYALYNLASSIVNAVLVIILFVISVIAMINMFNASKDIAMIEADELYVVKIIISLISFISATMLMFACLPKAVGAICSPTGAAISRLINMVV